MIQELRNGYFSKTTRLLWIICLWLSVGSSHAQTSDSVIVSKLRQYGITFSHDNHVKLLTSGQEKFDDMFKAIRQARESIHLEYFNFRNDSIARELFLLLEEKSAEGVEVRALFDGFGNDSNNKPLKKKHLKAIRSKGIEIYEFDPVRFPWINHVFTRDHRKIVIIDGCIAYTGGMNVADYYIKGTKQVGSWRDMHCRIEGTEVNELQRIFARIWKKVTKQELTDDKYYQGGKGIIKEISLKETLSMNEGEQNDSLLMENGGQMMVGIINREPHTTNKIIRQFYIDAINAAQDSIKLINPYLTLNHKLRKALGQALKRGVKLEVMVSEKSDIPLTPDCMFYNVHKLMKKGAEVWIYQPGFHHTKVIMVDGRFCTVGSANLNARSLRWDYEENAVIIDKNITRQLIDSFNRDKKDSFLLTKESWNKWRTPWKKFVGWFAHLLAPFL